MTWATELDDWTAEMATASGLSWTRDPALIHPPVVFVSLPESVSATLTGAMLALPVYVIGGTAGKQEGDTLLGMLPKVLEATGQQLASVTTMDVDGKAHNAYAVTVTVKIDAPPPPDPPGPTVPSAPGMPYADAWIETGGGWQYDLHWDLSADDGGTPITHYLVSRDGVPVTTVDGNTGILSAQFSLTYPVYCYVQAVNAAGTSPATIQLTATLNPPTP